MKNAIRTTCLLIAASLCLLAAHGVRGQSVAEAVATKHCLWSLDTEGGMLYLLGSIHVMRPTDYPLAPALDEAYETCDLVVFEADMAEANSLEFQTRIMSLGVYMDGQTLQENISAEAYAELEKRLAPLGLPMAQINMFRPWMCAVTLAMAEFQRLGFDPKMGIDQRYFNRAQADAKETSFMETADYQVQLMAGLTPQEQRDLLEQTLRDVEVMQSEASAMLEAWKKGDSDKLSSILNESFEKYPGIYSRLITDRNRNWISRLEELAKREGHTMVIVGAGHLVGPDNVIQLMAEKGYAFEQR